MTDAWSIEALISRFELHPEFKEIYVEGEGDLGIYRLFLEETGRDDVLVYPISAVAISDDCREEFGLGHLDTDSRRTEVILLAVALQREIPAAANMVTCIADADTQHIRPYEYGSSFLVFTDYTSIEMYGFRADFITRFIRIGSPNINLRGEDVLTHISDVLEKLFSFRIANYTLGWGLKWISPDKECTLQRGGVTFNEVIYARKYLNTKGRSRQAAEFWEAVNELRSCFGENHRIQIRGHDFVDLLAWYLKKCSYRAFHTYSGESVRHSLLCQLRTDDLTPERLFHTLLGKYPTTNAHLALPGVAS
jgi:hypothetical protein